MAARICGHPYKVYNPSSILGLFGSTPSKSTFLLKDLDELSNPLVLSSYPIPTLDIFPMALSVTKYIEKNLRRIFKIILEAQAPVLVPITFLEGSQERFFIACFPNVYCIKNYLNCYNFCQ